MSAAWTERLTTAAVRVTVIGAEGSTPREIGAGMTVTASGFDGTIGGGTLEHEAMAAARDMLSAVPEPWSRRVRHIRLGPELGQCCGGAATIMFERLDADELAELKAAGSGILLVRPLKGGEPPIVIAGRKDGSAGWPLAVHRVVRDMAAGAAPHQAVLVDDWFVEPLSQPGVPLYLYGAGHVGRAVVRAFDGLGFDIIWVDTHAERFPEPLPLGVSSAVARVPATIAMDAPDNAFHVVMTYSHAVDLAIAHAVLDRGRFAYLGVIGSKTKRARFEAQLRRTGITEAGIARMVSPIGLAGLDGKQPAVIAASLAADLLLRKNRTQATIGCNENKRPAT